MGELWREDGTDPVTFRSKDEAEAYAEMERLDLDRRESLVVRYLYPA